MKKLLYLSIIGLLLSGCINDLDVQPLDENIVTDDIAFSNEESYHKALSKVYSILAVSGQDGEGSSDIAGLDPGNAQLLRSWWNLQVITTDECKNSWGDSWVPEINGMLWTNVKNESIEAVYQWSMYIVSLANEFLIQASDSKLSKRGFSDEFKQKAVGMRAEARFLRTLAYYLLMDNYARPPFITESNYSTAPKQIERADLFAWIESELNEISSDLKTAGAEYGRADQGVVNFLLARIYLNAEVYTGTPRWADCITACEKVIAGGYELSDEYKHLFMTDNHITSKSEIIFPIMLDGNTTRTYGSMTYLIAASRAISDADAIANTEDGVRKDGWGGNRATEVLVKKFEFPGNIYEASNIADKRGMFNDTLRSLEINNPNNTFASEGWTVRKFKHISSTGELSQNETFADTDFPLFRLADAYLMYAEAVVRNGNANKANAVTYINKLRERGYGENQGQISESELSLDFILDERARELYWEGTRRQDLIRYDRYTTSDHLWPFKGGLKEGVAVSSHLNIFPIPTSDLSVNPNLSQNTGYN